MTVRIRPHVRPFWFSGDWTPGRKYDPDMEPLTQARALFRLPATGYVAAVVAPVAITLAVAWLRLPPFVFEHLVVLLVLSVAIPWGLGPAIVAAIVSVLSDNVLLREPIGSPTISGYRDVLDLALFAIVAIVVSGLVTRAQAARLVAQSAAQRERNAVEQRDRLIATVSHDLATPLSVLSGTVQFAKLQSGRQPVDWTRLLDRLETASARATSLVRTLSDAQALASDGLDLRLDTHDLRILVSPIVSMMDRFSDRHPVTLAVPDSPVLVEADADRLQRVVENLVNNAIKYSPDGGAVQITVATDDEHALLEVRDHGIGISPDALPQIFDSSYRAPEAATHAPGLGLGLSIAAQVVARHGGTISAAAAEGTGTVFSVRLRRVLNEVEYERVGAGASADVHTA